MSYLCECGAKRTHIVSSRFMHPIIINEQKYLRLLWNLKYRESPFSTVHFVDFDKTHLNIHSRIKPFSSSLPDQLGRLCPPHFNLPILTVSDPMYIVWTFYSYGHFTLWTFSDSSNLYGHFINMDYLPHGFFTHRS